MKMDEVKQLVRDCLNEAVTDQQIETLISGVPNTRDTVGADWFGLISNLEKVLGEMRDFESLYRTAMTKYGRPANLNGSIQRLEQIVALLNDVKPTVATMTHLQSKDMMV